MSDDHFTHHDSHNDATGDGDQAAAERHAQRAAEHFRRGRLAEAEKELRRALRRSPARGDLHFNLGLTLDAAGRLDEALASFREATARMPRQLEIRLAEATTLCRLGRFEDALGPLEAACAIDPACDLAWAKRIEALTQLGRFDDAETIYYIAQHRVDAIPLSLAAMGETQLAQGRHDRAAWCFREALSLEPLMPRLRSRLARALVAGGNHESGARLYLEELRDNPGDVATLLECGDLLASMHRIGEAMEKYRRAAERAPAMATPHVRLGLLLSAVGRRQQAQAEFEIAYGLDPDAPLCRSSYATALVASLGGVGRRHRRTSGHASGRRLGQRLNAHAEALRLVREDLARRGDVHSETAAIELGRMADLLLELGEPDEALALLERLRVARPRDPAVVRKLMVATFAAGRSRRARGLARRLVALDPGAAPAVEHNLVLDLIRRGRIRLASARARRALERHPDDVGLRVLRTRCHLASITSTLRSVLWPFRSRRAQAR